ncbi:MAG: helix-turn-helix domain-containing protein [Prolixibacteraceae bacterium]|nr:helix-turn-helix domain-containing protein [Prolixibacteraceae bacterium]
MKIMHEQVDFPGRTAIKVKQREMPYFTYPWHFHNECELLYIIDGFGTSFVADSIEAFHSGDLVLLGANLPHFWKSDESFLNNKSSKKVKYIVIQFPSDFFKEQISNYPEFHLLGELMERASRGIRFSPDFAKNVSKKIMQIAAVQGFQRILYLLELLQKLATTNQYRLLAGELYQHQEHDFTSDRLTRIMHYLTTSYQRKIELEKVSEIAHLHPSAFCRFFKEKTGKSLSNFVNDMRISYACRLIIEGELSVSQICFESGFNNLSNFNRAFKNHTGFTPTGYFMEFHKK